MAYVLPQVKVFQEFRLLPTAVIENLNAFVFGANYGLFRYDVDAEKALIGLGEYDSSQLISAYPNQPALSTVDQDYIKVYFENVWAEYINIAADSSAPIIMTSATERNKLRAAPVIGAGANSAAPGTPVAAEGYFTGHVALPEDYYLYPIGGALTAGVGAWDASEYVVDVTVGEGRLAYTTTEGLSGTVTKAASQNILTAGERLTGPDGLVLDFDTGADDLWRRPKTITLDDGSDNFTIDVNTADIKNIIDWDIDTALPLVVHVELASGGDTVAWDAVNHRLTIDTDTATLAAIHALLVADSDITTHFVIGALSGAGAVTPATAVDEAAVSVDSGLDVIMVRDAHRVRVTPNAYLFASGNGFTHSTHFKSRGVKIGDRVKYTVIDDATVTHEGITKVVGFEADTSLAAIADPTFKATNGVTQPITVLPLISATVLTPGADNQRAFDGAAAALEALDAVNDEFPGDMLNGVISDNVTVEIVTSGLAGTARALVSSDSGNYSALNTLIEASGGNDGQLYIGNNLVINFDAGVGDADAVFQLGDTFILTADVDSDFDAIAAADITKSGAYAGPKDTTYVIEVIRGGVFNRVVNATAGLQGTAGNVLVPSVNFSNWTGGDVNDEYVLKCTSAGDISTAQFNLTSQLEDDQTTVQFSSVATDIFVGGKGLELQFSAITADFVVGDYYIVRMNAARPQVRITDTSGVDNGSTEVVNDVDDINLGGFGAKVTFASNTNTEAGFAPAGGLLKGDVFYVEASASGDAAFRTLVLSDDLPIAVTAGIDASGDANAIPNLFNIQLCLVQASTQISEKKLQSPPDFNWVPTASDITVEEDVAVQDSEWFDGPVFPYLPVSRADVYVEYRALLPTHSTTIQSLADISEVEIIAGTIHPDNPLAQGLYNALSNSGDQPVYYMAIPSADMTGWNAVLSAATLTEKVYGMAPLTQDTQILNTVEAHINSMSTEENKRWRIGFVGTEMPSEQAIYSEASQVLGDIYKATITEQVVASGIYNLVTLYEEDGTTPAAVTALGDVVPGDRLLINFSVDAWGDATVETYTVADVLTNNTFTISENGPSVAVAAKAEVWHDLNVQEIANAVKAQSEFFANRRMYHVFPSRLGAFGVTQTSDLAAAAIAGLVSSVPPQQGLTNIEVNGFDDIPLVYSTFSREQLNTMAEGGTLIIMQELAGGEIFVRHQLSTATSDGNLLTQELSVTKNLDSISYYYANRLEIFIGKYNITPELLEVIRTHIQDGLNYLGGFTNISLLGPQIILEGSSILNVEEHPTLKDHIIANVLLQLPLPLNVIELHLVV